MFRILCLLCLLWGIAGAQEAPPPGLNVHYVTQEGKGFLWRGAAPRDDTLQALAARAKDRRVKLTFIDLRVPALLDDSSHKNGRLSPAGERYAAMRAGADYLPISSLDKELPERIHKALQEGDVYIHCMFGMNRTGVAVARFATSSGLKVDRQGLETADWEAGVKLQTELEAKAAEVPTLPPTPPAEPAH